MFTTSGLQLPRDTKSQMLVLYKWKSHFHEMKGDVGMSSHEKEREQEDAFRKSFINPLVALQTCAIWNCDLHD